MKKVYLLLLSLVVLMIALTGCGKDTLSSIAERFWVNPSYLSRYFKTYMGINIVQYIRSMRIFYAKSLLQSSDKSIAEVAEMVGIKSASHFSKIFENEVSESPSKFRKNYIDRNHS